MFCCSVYGALPETALAVHLPKRLFLQIIARRFAQLYLNNIYVSLFQNRVLNYSFHCIICYPLFSRNFAQGNI